MDSWWGLIDNFKEKNFFPINKVAQSQEWCIYKIVETMHASSQQKDAFCREVANANRMIYFTRMFYICGVSGKNEEGVVSGENL